MVLDTHVWLWWLSEPELLSKSARKAINEAVDRGHGLWISSISAWEVALLVNKGRLRLSIPAARFVERTEALGVVEFVPVTNSVALNSVDLVMHPDPADRIIVATALELRVPLVTKDEKLQDLSVSTIW